MPDLFVDPGFVDGGFSIEKRTVREILSNPEAQLNLSVELQSVHRISGAPKTWYFVRFLDSLLRRSRPDFLPFLRGVGPLTQILSEDILVGGLAQESAGSILLVQENPDYDLLSELLNYTFAGLPCIIKIGERGVDEYSLWPTFATFMADQEPTFSLNTSGSQISIPLATTTSRLLSEQFQVTHNIGIPTCVRFDTVGGFAAASHIDSYSLTDYTITARFSVDDIPTSRVIICSNFDNESTENNWNLYLDTDGKVKASASGHDEFLTPITAYTLSSEVVEDNDQIHTVILGVSSSLGDSSIAYLSIDGVLSDEQLSLGGVVDIASTSDIILASRLSGIYELKLLDVRVYNRYIPLEDAVPLTSVLFDSSDITCVAAWQFDDGNDDSTQVTDYSFNENHATLHGTVNVDYLWLPTDLGDSGLSGTPQPIVLGVPFNVKSILIDQFRNRFRISDTDSIDEILFQSINIRSRGIELLPAIDYTDEGDGVYQTVSLEPEPITFDIVGSSSGDYLTNQLYNTLLTYSGIDNTEINSEQLLSLSYLCPWVIGYTFTGDLTASEFMTHVCTSAGFNYYEDVEGKLFVDFALPPIGLGPYNKPCLDMRGQRDNRILSGNVGSVSGSHTLVAWFYTHVTDPTNTGSGLLTGEVGQYLVDKGDNYSLLVGLEGDTAGKILVSHGGLSITTLASPPGIVVAGQWQFIAVRVDDTAKTREIFYHRDGSTSLSLIASDSGWTGSHTVNSLPLAVGGSTPASGNISFTWGSVGYAQVWNEVLTEADLKDLISNPPSGGEPNLLAYISADEGIGLPKEKVSGIDCSIGLNPVWTPSLVIDLNIHSSIKLVDFKNIIPASKIVIKYRRNWFPMVDADIAFEVEPGPRADYKRQWSEVSANVSRKSSKTRTIILETCLTTQADALRLLRFMTYRFSEGRYIATVEFPAIKDGGDSITKRALASLMGDEIFLISDLPLALVNGLPFKVVGLTRDPINMSVRMILVG